MACWLVVLVSVFGADAGEEQPYLGVTMSAHAEPLTAEGLLFPHGVRVDGVIAGTAAAEGGLVAGDIIVRADDVDFDCPTAELTARLGDAIRSRQIGAALELTVVRDSLVQEADLAGVNTSGPDTLSAVQQLITTINPGEVIEFRAEKTRRLLTVIVKLGSRPVVLDGSVRKLPPNDEIIASPVAAHPAERFVETLLAEFELTGAYRAQREMLAGLVARRDALCPLRTAYVMRDPFTLPTLSRGLAEPPNTLRDVLMRAAAWLDQSPAGVPTEPLAVGLSPEEHARQIEVVLHEAYSAYERAFAGLSEEERAFLVEAVSAMSDALCADIMVQRDTDPERLEKVVRLVRLATRVDRAELIRAALHLVRLVEPEFLAGLRADLAGHGLGVFLTHETEFGKIVFAGGGDTWHQQAAAVVIDCDGSDFYTGPTPHPLSLIIDLGGNDEYAATFAPAHGSARAGVALLYDESGDDRYRARRWGQGSAAIGVGILHDRAGDDSYRAGDYSQAAAFYGVGVLIDEAGDDRYDAERFGQALALPGGFAAVIDREGADHYYCKGRDLGAYGTPGVFAGWGQGCGLGFRGVASGGVALLLDEAGNDVYEAGNFSQGGGYYFGWGALIDRAGDDRYLGSRYAQAFAAHQAVGYLEDHAGNDTYHVSRDVGQSCSWDQTVTALIDRGGDDTYSGGGFALGAAAHNGIALFLDAAGRDTYVKNSGQARASGNDYHGGTSLSLVLDLGGDEDRYAGGTAPNSVIRHTPEHGFFVDVPGSIEDALSRFREWLKR